MCQFLTTFFNTQRWSHSCGTRLEKGPREHIVPLTYARTVPRSNFGGDERESV